MRFTFCKTHFVKRILYIWGMALLNPFPLMAYQGPAYFCDRQQETSKLVSNALNGVNTTLISIRRLGKTILVHHVLEQLRKKKAICIYIDLHATLSQTDFLNTLSTAIVQALPTRQTLGRKIMDFVTGLKPVVSFDSLTGQPEISFSWQTPAQRSQSLQSLLSFLDGLDKTVVLALDEFQQIASYPEANTEALLRSHMQRLKNVRFIFSGSSRHLLAQMFTGTGRPFYASAQLMELHPIEEELYFSFIAKHFKDAGKDIEEEAIRFVLSWTRRHTWFTQVVCNRLFAEARPPITLALVQETCRQLLKEQETVFFQYRALLTRAQWLLLMAIAKEEKLYQPGAADFLQRHRLGNASTVKRGMEALQEKEMIYESSDEQGRYYQLYDCFLSRWLERG